MPTLRLNGIEVHASWLTQRSFRAAYCDFLLNVTPRNKAKALATFRKVGEFGPYSGLRISRIADLGLLSEFPDLLYLEVVDQKRVNVRHLDGLANLRGLHLESPGAGLDFSCFPELEVFVGDWHGDNCNLHRCGELRQLRARHFQPRSSDLSVLAGALRLDWLNLTQTTITCLDGLESLEDLRYLEIAYAPKLKSLDALAAGDPGIRELSISHAKSISTYRPIASMKRLRRLMLSSCAPMPDLKWTRGMNHLDLFSFVETNVADGDLSPLRNLPKLQYVGTMDKRHYNYKSNELNDLLNQRNRGTSANDTRR